jgi:glycosyltransferase involved in cell wall biosynthesis
MSDRLVSVIMPLSGVDKFTVPAVNSILNQSYSNFELIIIINGPNSDFYKNELDLYFDDKRIRIFSLSIRGLTNALNFGISAAKGEYIARMDGDDISSSGRLMAQADFLDKNTKVGVVGCRVKLMDELDNILPDNFFYFENNSSIQKILPIYNPMCHPAVMFRMKCLEDLGAYKYGFMSEDHELFIRIAYQSKWELHNLNDVLFYYRRHNNQVTSKNSSFKNFREISVFLLLHFMHTYNSRFLLGIIYILPPVIWFKKYMRRLIRKIS